MERRCTRLEILAQVTAHDYDLSLRYGDNARHEGEVIQIEDPGQTLGRLGGEIEDERVLRYQKGMTFTKVMHHLEGTALWAGRAALANRERPGIFHIWHTLEDARCENRLAETLPGTRKNFRAFVRPALERAERDHEEGQLPLFQQIQWGLYLMAVGFPPGADSEEPGALSAGWFDPLVADLVGELGAAVERAAASREPRAAFESAEEVYEALRSLLTEEQFSEGHREVALPEISEEFLDKEQKQKKPEPGEQMSDARSREREKEASEDEGEPMELTPEELSQLGHWAAPWFELQGHKKDVHPSAVRPDPGTIVVPPEGSVEEYQAIVENAGNEIKVLVWKLMQIIQERTYTRYSGAYRSGKLNTPKLWKQRLGKYHLFHRRENPERLNICFTLLVDESGSMNRESKYLAAREATVLFSEVLDRLGVPFEIIGYSTESSEAAMAAALGHVPAFKYRHIRHSPLQHRVYKEFDEPFGPIKTRLVNIYPRFNNWDEEHLLFAYRRLLPRGEREKIIIITSDGQPNGDASHLIQTVNRLEKLGIRIVGVGVVDTFVERIYPNHIVVRHLSQLTEELVQILRRELLGALAGGRAW